MEDIQPKQAPIEPRMIYPTKDTPERRHKRKIVLIAIAIIAGLAVIVGGVFWWIKRHQPKQLSPEETLQTLTATSDPVTQTTDDRAKNLDAMKKDSNDTFTTRDGKLQMLSKLNN